MLEVLANNLLQFAHVQEYLSHEAVVRSCPIPQRELQLSLLHLVFSYEIIEHLITEGRLIPLKT